MKLLGFRAAGWGAFRICQTDQGVLISDRLDGFIPPMREKVCSIGLDVILDGAEDVVLRDGVTGLTLEAVAAKAGISKGGLLYHYPSKERLIGAMVERIVRQWREDFQGAIESVPPGPGRVPRGCLQMCFEDSGDWDECVRRGSVVLLAALTANPVLVQPMRDCYADIHRRVREDGLKPGYAECVLAAVDGLWFSRIFGLHERRAGDLQSMRACLEEVIARGLETGVGEGTTS